MDSGAHRPPPSEEIDENETTQLDFPQRVDPPPATTLNHEINDNEVPPMFRQKSRIELVTETLDDIMNYFVPETDIGAGGNQPNVAPGGGQLTDPSRHSLLVENPPNPGVSTYVALRQDSTTKFKVNIAPTNQPRSSGLASGQPMPPARKSGLKTFMSPFQRKPTEDQVLVYMKTYAKIFGYLRGTDVIACRQVCRNWYTFSTPALRASTRFVFNAHACMDTTGTAALLKPWLLFTPLVHKSSEFVTYVEKSINKLSIWNSLAVRNATTNDLRLLMDSWHEAFICDLFKDVMRLELNSCTLEWATLFQFLSYFKGLESLVDIRNTYSEGVPIHLQVFQSVTGGTESPRTRNMGIGQDFVREFRKYGLVFKSLRVEDVGLGMNTGILLALLREALPPNSLQTLELTPGPERAGDDPDKKNSKEVTMFWIAVAEILLHSRDSLERLVIRCTHETTPRKAFDQFLSECVEYFNRAKGHFTLSLTQLTLDFSFIWLSSDLVESEFIPWLQDLTRLESLELRTVVMRPQSDERLQGLCPLMSNCDYKFGLHLTDLEGPEVVPAVTILMEDPLYQHMRSLTMSIHSRRTEALHHFWSRNERVTFPDLTSLSVNIMNPHFLTLNLEAFTKKFNGLTELRIVDGPILNFIGGHMAIRPDKLYSHMSRVKIGNREFQLILESYPGLRHLTLQGSMGTLTDAGVTGICQTSINRMIHHKDLILHEPEYEITGHAVCEMCQLETVDLRGLGEWVTDISVVFGFQKIPNLQNLVLYGTQRVRFGHKTCREDGTWFRRTDNNRTWSNYTGCVDMEDLQWRRTVITLYESGYLISICALILSLIIFCSFKCLGCTRVRIHKHLFVSFIISNFLWMAFYRLVVDSPDVLLRSPVWCRSLHVVVHYFMVANYFWMFCEGFYLHTLLVLAFIRSDSSLLRGFYIFGWGGPLIPTLLYVFYRGNDDDKNQACWVEDSSWNHILSIPVCASLVLSLAFLINILRVLVRKLKDNQRNFTNMCRRNSSIGAMTDNHLSLRKAVRATLILIPLLGLHYLLIPFRPSHGTSEALVYDVVAAGVASLQGFCVSLLFCFCNSEVIMVFRRKIRSDGRVPKSPTFPPDNSGAPTNHGIKEDERIVY